MEENNSEKKVETVVCLYLLLKNPNNWPFITKDPMESHFFKKINAQLTIKVAKEINYKGLNERSNLIIQSWNKINRMS